MFKSVLAATAAAPLFAGAAFAGPYVNVEANSGFTGSNYSGTAIDTTSVMKVLWVSPLLGTFKLALPPSFLTAVLLIPFLRVRLASLLV